MIEDPFVTRRVKRWNTLNLNRTGLVSGIRAPIKSSGAPNWLRREINLERERWFKNARKLQLWGALIQSDRARRCTLLLPSGTGTRCKDFEDLYLNPRPDYCLGLLKHAPS